MTESLAAYQLMRDHPSGAIETFRQLTVDYPDDALAAFHLQRLNANNTGDLIELSGK